MVFLMVQPKPHSLTGVFYYRGRVPADLVKHVKGEQVQVKVADMVALITLGTHFKVSLEPHCRRDGLLVGAGGH